MRSLAALPPILVVLWTIAVIANVTAWVLVILRPWWAGVLACTLATFCLAMSVITHLHAAKAKEERA